MNATECSVGSTRRSSSSSWTRRSSVKCLICGQLWLGTSTGPEPKTRLRPSSGFLKTVQTWPAEAGNWIPDFKITSSYCIAARPDRRRQLVAIVHKHVYYTLNAKLDDTDIEKVSWLLWQRPRCLGLGTPVRGL